MKQVQYCTFECMVVSILIGSCKFCVGLFYGPGSCAGGLDNVYSVFVRLMFLCSLILFSYFLCYRVLLYCHKLLPDPPIIE